MKSVIRAGKSKDRNGAQSRGNERGGIVLKNALLLIHIQQRTYHLHLTEDSN
jgi:hypothetical protein